MFKVIRAISALALGLYTCIKSLKMCIKSELRRDHFETCNIWAKRKGLSVVIKILSPVDCLSLPGTIYITVKHEKQFFYKPAANGQSDKGFLLTSKVCPQGGICPCSGAIYIYKNIKNVYKTQK